MQITINGAPIFFDAVGSTMALEGPALVERSALIVLRGGPGFDHAVMRPYFDRSRTPIRSSISIIEAMAVLAVIQRPETWRNGAMIYMLFVRRWGSENR
jgi:hypothetical protein